MRSSHLIRACLALGEFRASFLLRLSRSGATCSPRGAAGAGEEQEITDELLHEIDLLSSLRHPDLVMFLGACLDQHLPIMCPGLPLPEGGGGEPGTGPWALLVVPNSMPL